MDNQTIPTVGHDLQNENALPAGTGKASAHSHENSKTIVSTAMPDGNARLQDAMQAAGFHFVRIPRVDGMPSKGPRAKGWNMPKSSNNPNGYTSDVNQASLWLADGDNFGLALVPSKIVSLDIDDLDVTLSIFKSLGLPVDTWLTDPRRVGIRSNKPGKDKILFRAPDGEMPATKKLSFGTAKKARSILEIRHGSNKGTTLQDVLPPSIHPDTGNPYEWVGDPANIPEAPPELLALWRTWPEQVLKSFDPDFKVPKAEPRPKNLHPVLDGQRNPIAEYNETHTVEEVLLSNGYEAMGERYLRPNTESGIPGVVLFDDASRCFSHGADKLNDGKAHDAFDVYRLLECGGDWSKAMNWNPDITKHNQCNFRLEHSKSLTVPAGSFSPPALVGTDARDGTESTRPLTEQGNALRMLDAHGNKIRYVPESGAWLIWREGAWLWDVDGAAVRAMIANLPEQIYNEGTPHLRDAEHFVKWARISQKERTIQATVLLLKDVDRLRLNLQSVDAEQFLVGLDHCRQVIDLKTGTVRPATQSDYVTKTLNVDRLGDPANATRWIEFLSQVFGGDNQLIDWLRRWCGYLLTGSTREHIMLFFYGLGANGKSVFAETVRHTLGDYARAIAPETLTESRRQAGSASPDLAALIGARLALSSETEDGVFLAESLIKSLVSGDTMSVRQLYARQMQFSPQFKLLVLGNHRPIIRGTDNGIWRRVLLVPFGKTFSEDERDPELLEKLKVETPDILAWMVEGCLEWQRYGLANLPKTIQQATTEYRAEQDIIGHWLSECCECSSDAESNSDDLYRNYTRWCEINGLKYVSNIVLGRRLGEREFSVRSSSGRRIWKGLKLAGYRTDIEPFMEALDGL